MKKTIRFSIFSFFLIFITFQYSALSQNPQEVATGWKAGVAIVVITPEESLWMAGYSARNHPSEGVLHDLWAKALVIEDAKGKKGVLITNDLVSVPKIISDRIRDRIEARYSLTRSQIILNCSHTHSGPVLYNELTNSYPLDDDQLRKVRAYSEKYENQIVDLVGQAISSMVPVQLYAKNGVTRFQVNRRNNAESIINQINDLQGPNDYAVPVIKVVNETGDIIAVAFGYACHATVLSIYKFSGDYPGFAQIELEKSHPGITALFFQGAGADQNPLPRRTIPLAQQYGRTLAAAVERVLSEDMRELAPMLSTTYSEIDLQFAGPPPTKEELLEIMGESSKYHDYLKRTAKTLLTRIERGETLKSSYPYPCQIWKIGDQAIMSLGGELLIEYAIELKKVFGPDIFVLGYSNDVMAYIPSETVLKEGRYEGTRSAIFTTPWHSNIQSVILGEMARLAEQAGVNITQTQSSEVTGLRLATFEVDATPPIGYKMAYNPVVKLWDMGLKAKGVVLLGAGQPIVLLAVDWIGIANESQDEFKRTLASAAGTIPQRVAVHCLHQHDAPRGDIQNDFVLAVLHRLEIAVQQSLDQAQPVTHLGFGAAEVYKVASNRRIMGKDGHIRATRYTATVDSALRAEPEGLIDPIVSLISFWNTDKPLAILSFYATHPQSYYRLGIPNPDFPGVARFFRQMSVPDALHVHFNGAGGNIGAGKYNDGSHENRLILAERLADGMKRAWETSKREPIATSTVEWGVEPVALMPDTLKESNLKPRQVQRYKTFVQRYKAGKKIDIQCLALGNARIFFMPGELFVEYQLAAKAMRPDLFVTMAAYGEYGTGYIPTATAFKEGGYEAGTSILTPQVENVLMTAMRKLLKIKP